MSHDPTLAAAVDIITEYRRGVVDAESMRGDVSTLPTPVQKEVQRMDAVIRELQARIERARPRLRAIDPDYGGVLGADGQVHSDADPGL